MPYATSYFKSMLGFQDWQKLLRREEIKTFQRVEKLGRGPDSEILRHLSHPGERSTLA